MKRPKHLRYITTLANLGPLLKSSNIRLFHEIHIQHSEHSFKKVNHVPKIKTAILSLCQPKRNQRHPMKRSSLTYPVSRNALQCLRAVRTSGSVPSWKSRNARHSHSGGHFTWVTHAKRLLPVLCRHFCQHFATALEALRVSWHRKQSGIDWGGNGFFSKLCACRAFAEPQGTPLCLGHMANCITPLTLEVSTANTSNQKSTIFEMAHAMTATPHPTSIERTGPELTVLWQQQSEICMKTGQHGCLLPMHPTLDGSSIRGHKGTICDKSMIPPSLKANTCIA